VPSRDGPGTSIGSPLARQSVGMVDPKGSAQRAPIPPCRICRKPTEEREQVLLTRRRIGSLACPCFAFRVKKSGARSVSVVPAATAEALRLAAHVTRPERLLRARAPGICPDPLARRTNRKAHLASVSRALPKKTGGSGKGVSGLTRAGLYGRVSLLIVLLLVSVRHGPCPRSVAADAGGSCF
jgi:hypothetical protein